MQEVIAVLSRGGLQEVMQTDGIDELGALDGRRPGPAVPGIESGRVARNRMS
jgi:hypothetical protein